MITPPPTPIPSPKATGGAGNRFEQHVNAFWLTHVLLGHIPPFLIDSVVTEAHFQTRHQGWATDDFLIIADQGAGKRRKLAGQVKRTFTISAKDDDCVATIQGFWKDLHNTDLFNPAVDRFAIITQRGTAALHDDFAALLEAARAATDPSDFEHRLTTPGLLNKAARHACDEVQQIVTAYEKRPVTTAEVWQLLRVTHIARFDVTTDTGTLQAMATTLLAYTTSEPNPFETAKHTWLELVDHAAQSMENATTVRRETLPAQLRERHAPVPMSQRKALDALRDHSKPILQNIRTRIGKTHVPRSRLTQQVLRALETNQIVLLTGPAGTGKSALAKQTLEALQNDFFTFTFRAEEFARAHLDETLQAAQVPISAHGLTATLASQPKKVVFIDSLERLLEKGTRDAFTDLVSKTTNDPTLQLLLTCRNYSAETVRQSLLTQADVPGHAVVQVPEFRDEELDAIAKQSSHLQTPLSKPVLRRLLHNPFILDLALRLPWHEIPDALTESEFQQLFWKHIVRAEQDPAKGMPARRDQTFLDIALRRAQAMAPYADTSQLDAEVLAALTRDELVTESPAGKHLVAPAHDVYEDWAIQRWIQQQYTLHATSLPQFAKGLGTHPAIRRSYRKWASEETRHDYTTQKTLLDAALNETELPDHFRDDTLVSLLQSISALKLLQQHQNQLTADNNKLLKRLLHLLRVGCVTVPEWTKQAGIPPYHFNVPDGPAWPTLLTITRDNLDKFAETDHDLVIGLLEDWAQGVDHTNPYPPGHEAATAIARWLLPKLDDYSSEDERERILKILAKTPKSNESEFTALLRPNGKEENRRRVEEFQELLLSGLDGGATARDLPQLVIEVAKDFLFLTEERIKNDEWFDARLDVAHWFGFNTTRRRDFSPACSIRGPFYPLLRDHPDAGLDFVIETANRSIEWYTNPRIPRDPPEPATKTVLTFPDGNTHTQWANERLWTLYRGTSVGPEPFQTLLMALERWFLDYATHYPQKLDQLLLQTLKRTTSASVTAVITSTATAHPTLTVQTLLTLSTAPHYFYLDRHRLVKEGEAQALATMLPELDPKNRLFNHENQRSNKLSHRQRDLETAILDLQLQGYAQQVHAAIDQQKQALPAPEKQTREDKIRRNHLRRIDLREYTPQLEQPADTKPTKATIRFNPKPLPPELQEPAPPEVDAAISHGKRVALLMWAMTTWNRTKSESYDPSDWRSNLETARTLDTTKGESMLGDPGRYATGYTAAVCIRDHWNDLNPSQQQWCLDTAITEVERDANNWNPHNRIQIGAFPSDRPSASILPILLSKVSNPKERARITSTLGLALTHPVDEVRTYTAAGIRDYLWTVDADLARRCINTTAWQATEVHRRLAAEKPRPRSQPIPYDKIERDVATQARKHWTRNDFPDPTSYDQLDTSTAAGSEASLRSLIMFAGSPTDPKSISAYARLASDLVHWWDERDEHDHEPRRDWQVEAGLQDLLQHFLLRTTAQGAPKIVTPIIGAVDRHSNTIHHLVLGIISAERRNPNTTQFWRLWEQFAKAIAIAPWLAGIDDEHARGGQLLHAIFLGPYWDDSKGHWTSLEGNDHRIHDLFTQLPPSAAVTERYIGFLYQIGQQSLPQSFRRVADRLRRGNPNAMLRNPNTVFMLASLLGRFVYGRPKELKASQPLRDGVLYLLDNLVENGSSAAYRMRDDFVTPAQPTMPAPPKQESKDASSRAY